MKIIKRLTAIVLAMLLTAAMPLTTSAATAGFDDNHCQSIISDTGEESSRVRYYANGTEVSRESLTWLDDPTRGKVLALDGVSQYLTLSSVEECFKMTEMTFATWINFQGAPDEKIPTGAIGQYLFSLYGGEERYFEMSPYEQDLTTMDQNGFSLNGLCTKFYRSEDETEQTLRFEYTPVQAEYGHTALPEDEWHHIAIVIDSVYMQLYIDGNLILESVFGVAVSQMYAPLMYFGRGHAENSYLHAMLDDMMVFDKALEQDQLRALVQTNDVTLANKTSEEIAAMTVITTSSLHLPTVTQTTMATTTTNPNAIADGNKPLGLPLWGYGICIAIVAVVVILCVLVNIYEVRWRKANQIALEQFAEEHDMTVEEVVMNAKEAKKKRLAEEAKKKADQPEKKKKSKKKKGKDDGEQPAMSIKEAAMKKRQEDLERFMKEEQADAADKGGNDHA